MPDTVHQKHIMFVAGEVSGDTHAAHLIEELKKLDPSLTFSGLGGPLMKAAGMELFADLTQLAVVGFWEVLKHYWIFRRLFHDILSEALARRPEAVVLVDYPGFNMRLARKLKKAGIKVIYYISPQVWAWKANRVKAIARDVDLMLVLFAFEKEFYAQRGVDVCFVGNPLVDNIRVEYQPADILDVLSLETDKLTIGLLPGSREREISAMLPVMLQSAELFHRRHPNVQFLVCKAPGLPLELFTNLMVPSPLPIALAEGHTYNNINACTACIVTSGTATLETALLRKPMVVVYKTSWLTYCLAKLFIKIPNIGLVNVVAGKRIVPECVQDNATPVKITQELEAMLGNEPRLAEIHRDLEQVKLSLGESGASRRAAVRIVESLK